MKIRESTKHQEENTSVDVQDEEKRSRWSKIIVCTTRRSHARSPCVSLTMMMAAMMMAAAAACSVTAPLRAEWQTYPQAAQIGAVPAILRTHQLPQAGAAAPAGSLLLLVLVGEEVGGQNTVLLDAGQQGKLLRGPRLGSLVPANARSDDCDTLSKTPPKCLLFAHARCSSTAVDLQRNFLRPPASPSVGMRCLEAARVDSTFIPYDSLSCPLKFNSPFVALTDTTMYEKQACEKTGGRNTSILYCTAALISIYLYVAAYRLCDCLNNLGSTAWFEQLFNISLK